MKTGQPSILVVEDEYLPALHLTTVLAKEGFRVLGPATNGAEAERLALEGDPDLILMDIRLAGKDDGIEIAKRLRERFRAEIIFMSGYQESSFRERAMELKPLGFLVKPVFIKDIMAIIARATDRPRA